MTEKVISETNDDKDSINKNSTVSTRLLGSLGIENISFFYSEYDKIYPKLASIVPGEKIIFQNAGLDTIIACETVCAAICHQMNWDFLRSAVWKKTQIQPKWILAEALSEITADEVNQMLLGYNKPERIRADERASILRQIGALAYAHGGFSALFFKSENVLASETQIRKNLLECQAFSQDPEEKKLQLLLQKLSNYTPLNKLADFC